MTDWVALFIIGDEIFPVFFIGSIDKDQAEDDLAKNWGFGSWDMVIHFIEWEGIGVWDG